MNPFYDRLLTFAAKVEGESAVLGIPLNELFTVVHPPYPVLGYVRRERPDLEFKEDCPTELRKRVRQLLRQSFKPERKQRLLGLTA